MKFFYNIMCYVNSCYDAQKKKPWDLKTRGKEKRKGDKRVSDGDGISGSRSLLSTHVCQALHNRVINRSITRSLADSCDFKAIRLRAAAHITSFLKTDPHKGLFISLCVCGPILHTIVMWETQRRKDKTKAINTMKISHAIHRFFFSKYMKILF